MTRAELRKAVEADLHSLLGNCVSVGWAPEEQRGMDYPPAFDEDQRGIMVATMKKHVRRWGAWHG